MKNFTFPVSLISVLAIFLVSTQMVSAATFNDLTSYQKQKYWDMWKNECQSLLLTKQYSAYRTCALNVLDKASKIVEADVAWCSDSDNGIDFFNKGVVKTDLKQNGIEDFVYTFPNGSTYLFEGVCSPGKHYAYVQKNCSELGSKYYADQKAGACVWKNNPPTVDVIPAQTVKEGEKLTFTVNASDLDGDILVYSGKDLPPGSKIDQNIFSWKPTYSQSGSYTITVIVSDGESEANVVFSIDVIEDGCGGKEIFVSNSGSDSNSGTTEQPYETVKFAVDQAKACDDVIVTVGIYDVPNKILVMKDVTLVVKPGVIIKFGKDSGLQIGGELIATGTENSKIYFTSITDKPMAGDWNNLVFIDTATDAKIDDSGNYLMGSIVKHCVFEYGGGGNKSIIEIFSSSPYIDNNTISHGGHGIFNEGDETIIINNTLFNNSRDGIRNYRNNVRIKNNVVKNNGWHGIFNEGDNNLMENNTVSNNTLGGIYQYGGQGNSIVNNLITDNYVFGIRIVSINTLVENNLIENNKGDGIEFFGGSKNVVVQNNIISKNTMNGIKNYFANSVTIIKNSIVNNLENGVLLGYGGSFGSWGGLKEFENNNIYGNILFNFNNGYQNDIVVSNNYWGTTDLIEIDKKMYDKNDDLQLGEILYKPIATKAF